MPDTAEESPLQRQRKHHLRYRAEIRQIHQAHEQKLRKRSELDTARQGLCDSLRAGRDAGMTLQELADLVGLTRQRVHELLS